MVSHLIGLNCSSDPFIVLVLSLSFIGSIFFLHISAKVIRAVTGK